MYRIIDANINRICEGLRIIEDFIRFNYNSKEFIELKKIRHYLRETIADSIKDKMLFYRNPEKDPGKKKDKFENNRKNIIDVIKANILRAEEGLRVLEETFKLYNDLDRHTAVIKSFRFILYGAEKKILSAIKGQLTDISNFLSLDIGNISTNNYKSIIKEIFINNKITAFDMICGNLRTKDICNIIKMTKNSLKDCNIKLFIRNRLDLAQIYELDGITADNDYAPYKMTAGSYQKSIGIIVRKNNYNLFNEIRYNDFIIVDDIDNKEITDHYIKNNCKYTVKNKRILKSGTKGLIYGFYGKK